MTVDPYDEAFYVPDEVYKNFADIAAEKAETEAAWNVMFAAYCEEFPEMEALWKQYHEGDVREAVEANAAFWAPQEKADATRSISGKLLNQLKDIMPNLIGGSADLGPSNKTTLSDEGDFSKENPAGRNMHFGVREQAMAAIGNGTAARTPQDESRQTYASMLTKEMSPIDWTRSAREIDCQVRGLIPWPCAACELAGQRFKVYRTAPGEQTGAAPGTVLSAGKQGIRVACGGGESLYITELQAEGGKRMVAGAYLLGHPLEV